MKPTSSAAPALSPLLVFGAHPDDIEFGCGGVIVRETQSARKIHFVICSRGESASHGSPAQRTREAKQGASLLGASLEFLDFGGDAHFENKLGNVLQLARVIRRVRPGIVLAPTLVENQHPDHAKLGAMVRDACRLARFGGVKELRALKAHPIESLLYYAITADAEPTDLPRILIDISTEQILTTWQEAMTAHATQLSVQKYVELQLLRARLNGLRAGLEYAIALFPNDPLVFSSLGAVSVSARKF